MRPLRAIDFCSGAGGWACAARGLPIEWVAVADMAADCLETWQLNHGAANPGCALVQCDLSTSEGLAQLLKACKGGVDLFVGGIPCEQVSRARANRKHQPGEMESWHRLIDHCFAAVKALAPRWWCVEDVIGVEGHLVPPIEWGTDYEVRRIHAEEYGPQARLRTFFGRYPEPSPAEPGPRVLGEILRPGPYRTLSQLKKYQRSTSKWYGGDKIRVQEPSRPGATVLGSQGGRGSRTERSAMVPLVRVEDTDQPSPTIASFNGRHERAALVEVPPTSRERPQDLEEPSRSVLSYRQGVELPIPLSAQSQVLDPTLPAPTITGNMRHDDACTKQDGLVRVMEWQEAATLQGFPEDYVFAASWSRVWKLVAQAIPIQVGRAILKAIVEENVGCC